MEAPHADQIMIYVEIQKGMCVLCAHICHRAKNINPMEIRNKCIFWESQPLA